MISKDLFQKLRKDNQITLHSEDDAKAKQVFELLIGHIVKRSLDPKVIKFKGSGKIRK